MEAGRVQGKIVKFCLFLLILIFILAVTGTGAMADDSSDESEQNSSCKVVYLVDISVNFSDTMVSYVSRALEQAEADQADYLLINLNCDSPCDKFAMAISQALLNSPVDTLCYINDRALNGAALVALSCDTIIMSPGSDFGMDKFGKSLDKVSAKKNAYWFDALQKIAQQKNHGQAVLDAFKYNAMTMSPDSEKNWRISSSVALKCGLAEYEATSIQIVLDDYNLFDGVIIQVEKNFYERGVDNLASPLMATMMLIIGVGALLVEILLSGYGVAGITGIICLFLYFFGGYQSGAVESYVVFFLISSITLILLEVFLSPGNGVCGAIGVIALFYCMLIVAPTTEVAMIQLVLVIAVVVILTMVSIKKDKENKNIFGRLILRDKTTTEEGYLSQPINIRDYLGKEGVALTALRPAGAVKIGTDRVDVVTEGDFIAAGDRVMVIKVDGSSVIVRQK